MPKKKVLLVHNIVAPYRLPLFEQLGKLHDLTVFFCSFKTKDRKWQVEQTNASYQSVLLPSRTLGPFVFNFSALKYLRQQQFDVLIVIDNEENCFTNLLAVWLAKWRKKPYVLWSGHLLPSKTVIWPIEFHKTVFHRWPIRNIYEGLINTIHRYLYQHASNYLAYSDMSKQYLEAHGVAGEIIVGTQAMDKSLMPAATEKKPLDSSKLQLLYLGYLRPEKGIDVLLRAVMKLPTDRVELHVVGDGPELPSLQALTKDHLNIIYHPYAHAQERANWYQSVDVMVLPTYFDPWAHVVTESLYYGTPVLTTSSAAASTIIVPKKNGIVVEAGSAEQLQAAIQTLIDQPTLLANMKRYTATPNQRLYNVAADARNFGQAIEKATNQ